MKLTQRYMRGGHWKLDTFAMPLIGDCESIGKSILLCSLLCSPSYQLRDLWHGEDLQEVKVGKQANHQQQNNHESWSPGGRFDLGGERVEGGAGGSRQLGVQAHPSSQVGLIKRFHWKLKIDNCCQLKSAGHESFPLFCSYSLYVQMLWRKVLLNLSIACVAPNLSLKSWQGHFRPRWASGMWHRFSPPYHLSHLRILPPHPPPSLPPTTHPTLQFHPLESNCSS